MFSDYLFLWLVEPKLPERENSVSLHHRQRRIQNSGLSWDLLTIFSISSILDVQLRSKYVTGRNFKCLSTELYKILRGLSLGIMEDIFPWNSSLNYLTRNGVAFYIKSIKSVCHGTESLSFLASKRWELVPNIIKLLETLSSFRVAIKLWKPQVWA